MSSNETSSTSVVVLDDDADTRFALKRILSKCGCEVYEAETVEETLAIAETFPIDIIFSDMRIPAQAGGEELLVIVKEDKVDVQVVLMSCAMDDQMRTRLMGMGAAECVKKPFFKDRCEQILSLLDESLKKAG